MIGELPTQSFHKESIRPTACNACSGVVDLILHDQLGVSPRAANGATLHEFEEMMDDKLCREELTCMPLRRLHQANKK